MDYNEVAYVHKLFVDDNKLKPAAYEQNVRVYRKGGRNLLPIKRIGVEKYVVDWEKAENLKERPRKKHKPRRDIPLYLRPSGNKYIGSALEERERERDFLEKGGILLEPDENAVLKDCVTVKRGRNIYLIKNGEVLIQVSESGKIINFNFDPTHNRFKGKK